jgi:hypothetical protein
LLELVVIEGSRGRNAGRGPGILCYLVIFSREAEGLRVMRAAKSGEKAVKVRRLEEIRAKLAASVNDPRPSLTTKEVGKRLKALHQKAIKARSS